MIKKILKLIAVAQAIAFPVISAGRANGEVRQTEDIKETNTLYKNAIVDSLYIADPKNTQDLINDKWKAGYILRLSPAYEPYEPGKSILFRIKTPMFDFFGGFAIWQMDFNMFNDYVDVTNLIGYQAGEQLGFGYYFGDVKIVPENKRNKNVILNFKKPMRVKELAPGVEKFIFNPKPVDKFALTYNGLLNGYAYNLLGGREDIDKKRFREYIKNHVSLQTEGFWKGEATFTIATFKNGTEEFEIVGWCADYPNSTNISIATNYKAKSISGIKLLCGYIFNDSGEVISEATNSTNIDKYYTCTIVDETAAKYVLTGGPDFSYFLDYTKDVGFPYGYAKGYTDGQNNPTFRSFIVSAFEACSAFFSLPVLGQNITVGTLIGSFIGLGALFLIIKLFR